MFVTAKPLARFMFQKGSIFGVKSLLCHSPIHELRYAKYLITAFNTKSNINIPPLKFKVPKLHIRNGN